MGLPEFRVRSHASTQHPTTPARSHTCSQPLARCLRSAVCLLAHAHHPHRALLLRQLAFLSPLTQHTHTHARTHTHTHTTATIAYKSVTQRALLPHIASYSEVFAVCITGHSAAWFNLQNPFDTFAAFSGVFIHRPHKPARPSHSQLSCTPTHAIHQERRPPGLPHLLPPRATSRIQVV